LIIEELDDEVLVYDLKRDRASCLNRTAALVWRNCDGRSSVKRIARRLEADLQATVSEELVWLALKQLSRHDLLEGETVLPPHHLSLSRRALMRRAGAAAMVAIPLITSLIAPTPALAGTCLPTGSPCSTSAECCSGLCAVTCI
jgi:hypothetical protein